MRVFEVEVGDDALIVLSLPVEGAQVLGMLTDAEREVAIAVLDGLSSREVARARGTSPRTVANQLDAIYKKLGISSRAELAACIARNASDQGSE